MITPLAVKKSLTTQKYRIPFKNMSSTQDGDYEFTFVRCPSIREEGAPEDEALPIEERLLEHLEFFCSPAQMKISANQ